MIDLNWIASQPKPVAIHCPTYHDIMTVLCDVNESRDVRLNEDDIIREADEVWGLFGEDSCVRLGVSDDGLFNVWHEELAFYRYHPAYIFVSINKVKIMIADLGEIDADISDLSALFGTEVSHV